MPGRQGAGAGSSEVLVVKGQTRLPTAVGEAAAGRTPESGVRGRSAASHH